MNTLTGRLALLVDAVKFLGPMRPLTPEEIADLERKYREEGDQA